MTVYWVIEEYNFYSSLYYITWAMCRLCSHLNTCSYCTCTYTDTSKFTSIFIYLFIINYHRSSNWELVLHEQCAGSVLIWTLFPIVSYLLTHQNANQSLYIYSSISIITDHLIKSRSLSACLVFSVLAPQVIEIFLAPKQLCCRIFLLLFSLMLLVWKDFVEAFPKYG